MIVTGNLEFFLLELGDRLYEAANELQSNYDNYGLHMEFITAQVMRKMLQEEIPNSISDIINEKFEAENFDFMEWWTAKRGTYRPAKTKKPMGLVRRFLIRFLCYLTNQEYKGV